MVTSPFLSSFLMRISGVFDQALGKPTSNIAEHRLSMLPNIQSQKTGRYSSFMVRGFLPAADLER